MNPITQWRKANRYSQAGFAAYLWPFVVQVREELRADGPNTVLTGSHIQAWERGSQPRLVCMLAIERATGIKPSELATGQAVAGSEVVERAAPEQTLR